MNSSTKAQRILEAKATCFDSIANLLLTLDSHRNFHLRVSEAVHSCKLICQGIANAASQPNPANQIKCELCSLDAQCQGVYPDDSSMFLCLSCADKLFAKGEIKLVDESIS